MIKVNFADMSISLNDAINAALDISEHCVNVPVAFEFQGVEFVVTAKHANISVPQVSKLENLCDWNDEYLSNEVIRRCINRKSFALLLMDKIANHCR